MDAEREGDFDGNMRYHIVSCVTSPFCLGYTRVAGFGWLGMLIALGILLQE